MPNTGNPVPPAGQPAPDGNADLKNNLDSLGEQAALFANKLQEIDLNKLHNSVSALVIAATDSAAGLLQATKGFSATVANFASSVATFASGAAGAVVGLKTAAAAPAAPGGGGGGGGFEFPAKGAFVFNEMAVAAGHVAAQLKALYEGARRWVEAFDPGAVANLDAQYRNLQATLGSALVPLFNGLATVVERLGGILLPVVQQLTPVFEQLAQILLDAVLPLFRVLGEALSGLAPVFALVGSFVGGLVNVLATAVSLLANLFQAIVSPALLAVGVLLSLSQVFGQVVAACFEVISSFLQPFALLGKLLVLALTPLTTVTNALNRVFAALHSVARAVELVFEAVFETLSDMFAELLAPFNAFIEALANQLIVAVQYAAGQVILFAASLAAAFGATDFIKKLVKVLERQGNERGLEGAPQNVGFKGFEDIAKGAAQAAFTAGGKSPQETTNDYLKSIVPALKELAEGKGLSDLLDKQMVKFLDDMEKWLRNDAIPMLIGTLPKPLIAELLASVVKVSVLR